MRLVAICEDLPDASPTTANGSTMISASVLARMPDDVDIDLVCFDDGRRRLDPELAARCHRVVRLPLRSARGALAATVFSPLPRATWRRTGSLVARRVHEMVQDADVLYVHGLHAFGVAAHVQGQLRRPAVFCEVDDWSENFRQRAENAKGAQRWYGLLQAARTRRLERAASAVADSYVVVAAADAERLAQALGRSVDVIPNGVAVSGSTDRDSWDGAPTLGFLGTLAYAPNVDAVTRLVRDVLPRVLQEVPQARVLVAGRHAGPEIQQLAGPAVEVVGEVPDAGAFYRSVGVMVYPGELGTGAKNTVAEAIAAGAAVVASSVAARGVSLRGQLVIADGAPPMAHAVVALLDDPSARAGLCRTAAASATGRQTWDAAAMAYVELLRSAVRARAVSAP